MSQPQQQLQVAHVQKEETRIKINVPHVEGASEKLRCILRSHKIRSTFYTESTLCNLVCKLKDGVATENKKNVVYEIDCSNCETVYFGEYKQSLKPRSVERKKSARNGDCERNKTRNHWWQTDHSFSWDQKKVVDRESRLVPTEITDTIHSLKNPNHINKISYIVLEMGLANLR